VSFSINVAIATAPFRRNALTTHSFDSHKTDLKCIQQMGYSPVSSTLKLPVARRVGSTTSQDQ